MTINELSFVLLSDPGEKRTQDPYDGYRTEIPGIRWSYEYERSNGLVVANLMLLNDGY